MNSLSARDLQARVARGLYFPWKELALGRDTVAVLRELEATQWWSRERLRARQWTSLRRLIGHAYERVPFYRRTFHAAGVRPPDVRSFEDFARLPILRKQDLREHGPELIASGMHQEVEFRRTSGSTGEPLHLPSARALESSSLAHCLRGRAWWGVGVGDREFKFWGQSAAFETTRRAVWLARLRQVKDTLLNVRAVSAFDMTAPALDRAANWLRRDRPTVVFGYGTALYLFACHLRDRGFPPSEPCPRVVIYTSEWLSEGQRAEMRLAYGAPVAAEYGAVECGIIGYEAPCGRMHASDEAVFLETVVGEDGLSRVLVTHLHSAAAPLIRYDLGDLVELAPPEESCECGRGLSIIRSLRGRCNDLVLRPDGEVVHAELFDYVMRQQSGVRRYQIVQSRPDAIEVLLETDAELSESRRRSIQETMRPYLGSLAVEVRQVAALEPLPSAKFQWVVSRLHSRPAVPSH